MENNKKRITVKCEQNVCPICGSMNLAYCGERIDDDDGCTYGWTCEDCGASGREGHSLQFDGNHYDVETGDGEAVEIVAPEVAPDPDEICPVCGGKLEFYDTDCLKYTIEKKWGCPRCGATGSAEFEEEYVHTFTEHKDVRLADGSVWDGKPIPATESAEEEHRITGRITLLNDFDMEDALLALADANIGANEEHGRITIIDASVSDAVEALANEGILLQAITYEGNDSPAIVPPATKKVAVDAECIDNASSPAEDPISVYDNMVIFTKGGNTYVRDSDDGSVHLLELVKVVIIEEQTDQELLSPEPDFDFDVTGELDDGSGRYCYWKYADSNKPATKTWKIPVTWEMCGYAYVEAATLDEAVDKVRCDNDDIPLPGDASFVDGSFAPSYDDVEEIRSLHNNGEQDLEVLV